MVDLHHVEIIKRRVRYGYTWKCSCGAEEKRPFDKFKAEHRANHHVRSQVIVGPLPPDDFDLLTLATNGTPEGRQQ